MHVWVSEIRYPLLIVDKSTVSHLNLHGVSKNAPTLASCSLDKHELILIIFGQQHQHTFRNDTRIQLSLSVYFYLFHLPLSSSDWNIVTRSDVPLCSWNSPAPLAGNTRLSLSRSVSAKQSGWLQNLWTDVGTCVHCTNTCSRYQPLWPATWSASLTHEQCKPITKRHRWSSWSTEKAITCKHEAKGHHCEHLLN